MSAGEADQANRRAMRERKTVPEAETVAETETVADFLGLLAGIEIAAFPGRGRAVALAGSAADKAAVGAIAVAGFRHFRGLCERLAELEADPDERMDPFRPAVTGFERRTEPGDLYEALVKLSIAEGLAADLHRLAAPNLDVRSRRLVEDVLAGDAHADVAVPRVHAATEADSALAARLSMWARRLVGEVLGRTQAAIAARPGLAELIIGTEPDRQAESERSAGRAGSAERPAIARAVNRCAGRHGGRMRDLGLRP
jgi:hypothetical protein